MFLLYFPCILITRIVLFLPSHLGSYFEDRAQCIRGYTLNWVSLLALALLDVMLVQYYVTRASMRKVRTGTSFFLCALRSRYSAMCLPCF